MVDKILERKLYMLSRWEDRHLVRAHLFSGASFNNEMLLSNLPVNCYGAYFTINSYGINGETGEVTGFLIDNVITGLGAPSANREYRFEVVSAIR